MKSSDILRAFTDAGADFAEQAADTNGKTYQPDISAALDAIRGKDDAPPVTAAPEHESRMNRILLWACGIAACAAVGVTAVLFASRANSGNIIQPEGNAGGSVPMTVMTNPTTAEIIPAAVTDRDIPFTVSKANYTDDEGFLSPDEQEALKSCVIRSAADLKANKIQPEKEYTDAFFDDHALIFVSTIFSCTGDLPEVTKVHVSGGTIEVTADREPAMDEAVQWWCTFIEVSQADIAGTGNQIILHSDTQIQKQTELPASDSNLAFTVSDAVYQIADGSGSYNDLKNMVFFDTESLKRSPVQPVKQYDDAFFKDHALIFVTHVFSSMNQHETVIHSVHRTENALEIYAERTHDAVEAAALQWWCTFLEIDRAELEENRAYDNVMLHVDQPYAEQPAVTSLSIDLLPVFSETTTTEFNPLFPQDAFTEPTFTTAPEYTLVPLHSQNTETTAAPVSTAVPVNTAVSGGTETVSNGTEHTGIDIPARHFEYARQQPYSFLMRLDDTYDDDLHVETGREWLEWFDGLHGFYCAGKGDQQDMGVAYAINQYYDCDILWFKVNITGDYPEIRKISYNENGKLTVEAAMVHGELDPGVYRVCLPVPHCGTDSFFQHPVKIWELVTKPAADESGELPQCGEQLTMEILRTLVEKGKQFTWNDLVPYAFAFRIDIPDHSVTYRLEDDWLLSFSEFNSDAISPIDSGELYAPDAITIYRLNDDILPWNKEG